MFLSVRLTCPQQANGRTAQSLWADPLLTSSGGFPELRYSGCTNEKLCVHVNLIHRTTSFTSANKLGRLKSDCFVALLYRVWQDSGQSWWGKAGWPQDGPGHGWQLLRVPVRCLWRSETWQAAQKIMQAGFKIQECLLWRTLSSANSILLFKICL